MPGLAHKDEHSSSGFWSSDVDGVSYIQLNKFWSELSLKARQELLRINKQALFEQARKNMCCSRCNGLLLEGFLKIVKSSQQKGSSMQDPDTHLWGGLTTTRDESLTLLDCYLNAKSFNGLQTVFESARARERKRQLLFPEACGGGGRVWISRGMSVYGKGHGTRETCVLHNTRPSCGTLVEFWSALEDECPQSLLTMKEEDFMERLIYRFDSKNFCVQCRRNVIREFKALKELKRTQRETLCTDWFCGADTAFQYQVDFDSVRADWSQKFPENAGYQFEWAIGTEKGVYDILEFKRLGNNRSAQVNGLSLSGFPECYITLRASKKNGPTSEISVKAHAIDYQRCVHSWLVVGDGIVSIKRGKHIKILFEHAENVEEEENDALLDQDGNELDGECFSPQKHAKSPELAREFLLDAVALIFKEQVEKAYMAGRARNNAHSIFVCLSSKLLEQRFHDACKEIITLEKQKKLLEEEENEKRVEEERKERKRTKEREKKLRKKERLKEKERQKEQKNPKFNGKAMLPKLSREEEGSMNLDMELNNTINCEESGIETGDVDLSPPGSPDDQDEVCLDGCIAPTAETHNSDSTDREIIDYENGCCTNYSPGPAHQTERLWEELQPDHALKSSDKCRYPENASFVHMAEARYCNDSLEPSSDSDLELSKPVNRTNMYTQSDCRRESRPQSKETISQNSSMVDPVNVRKVLDSMQLKHPRNSSHSDAPPVTCSTFKAEECEDVNSAVKSADTQSGCKGKANHNDDLYSKDPMMSRTSSSDNCSSCLSEGDSNTDSSNNRNTESSPMSDSEDASQHFEGRENLADTENDMLDCHEKMIEKETEKSIDERDLLRIKKVSNHPAENGESKLSGTPFTVLSQNMENTVPSVNTGSYLSQPQSMMYPQMLNQSIPFPVFQAPSTMDYYHEAPVSWSAPPANGLMPFPHPNHYVYTGPLGYSLNGESPLCLQYGTPLNHSATSFFNSGPAPVFHQFTEINSLNTVDQVQTLDPLEHSYLKEAADERKINRISPVETPSIRGPQTDRGEDFSLFHFGGPVALSTGSKSNPAHFRDGTLGDFSLQFSGDHVYGDTKKKKKESTVGEEYNLFATSNNSLRFSMF